MIKNFIKTCKELYKYFTKCGSKELFVKIGEILLILIFLCFLKIPFVLIRDVIINSMFSMSFSNDTIMNVIYLVFDLPYYLLALFLFMKIIVDRYKDINNVTKKEVVEEKKEEPKETKKD
jgi:uncharacterized membrane protein YjgN (DUF898 family)